MTGNSRDKKVVLDLRVEVLKLASADLMEMLGTPQENIDEITQMIASMTISMANFPMPDARKVARFVNDVLGACSYENATRLGALRLLFPDLKEEEEEKVLPFLGTSSWGWLADLDIKE